MSKHTPGPWTVKYSEATKILDSDDCTLAWVGQMHLQGRRSPEQVGANARLMATAPDMLIALELAWKALIYDPDFVDIHTVTSPAKAAVRAAIVKAKGLAK